MTDTDAWSPRSAQYQTTLPPERLLHSGNAGIVIHRTGQLEYEMAAEGRDFSVELVNYMNRAQVDVATTFLYEEVFGVRDRVHWFVHMKSPELYSRLLEMVDHDAAFQDISLRDRLPKKGGGNWEKMFVYGSLRETIMCPQHGFANVGHDEHPTDPRERRESFVPPATHQTTQPPGRQLNSANAGAIVLRTGDVRYEFREEGRRFLYDWSTYVNDALPGQATAFVYEQTWGQQDRIHCLIHLRDLEDYRVVQEVDRSEGMHKEVYDPERVPAAKGGGRWDRLFVPTSINDVVMVPHFADRP
ncbi:hypothetical protein DQ384_27945 [Sphaerisporangium album]|uniref:Uncharacterized protein n=1 Tax=Sphaerisporangium album TaxID=509200 RepID=A0A367F9M1_9ACTN|nr:DUF6039 family protein [Sphaerisporangium album]RCG27076.1 hypothetical protein DQ384_27945 [Sphaerisporangium album]